MSYRSSWNNSLWKMFLFHLTMNGILGTISYLKELPVYSYIHNTYFNGFKNVLKTYSPQYLNLFPKWGMTITIWWYMNQLFCDYHCLFLYFLSLRGKCFSFLTNISGLYVNWILVWTLALLFINYVSSGKLVKYSKF
jgi:hypothetical protein